MKVDLERERLSRNLTSGKACGGEWWAVGDTGATDLVAV